MCVCWVRGGGSGCRSIYKGDSQQSTFSNGGIPSVSHHLSGGRSFPLFCYPETAGVQVWLPAFDKKLSESPLFNLRPSYSTPSPLLSLGSLISFSTYKLLISPRWRETGEEVWDVNAVCTSPWTPTPCFTPVFCGTLHSPSPEAYSGLLQITALPSTLKPRLLTH